MTRSFAAVVLLGALGAILQGAATASADQENSLWQVGSSISFLTGDYGEEDDTDMWYVPLGVKRYFSKGDVALIVPYVDISLGGGATFVGDGVVAVPGGVDGGSGIGDIILKGRYYATQQENLWPFIDVGAGLKLPTADEDKGLGTGEADLTFLVEITRVLENNWIVLAELGYTFIGEPSGTDLDNRFIYSIGAARKINEQVMLSSYLDGRTAIAAESEESLSILFIGEYEYRPDLRFDAMLEIGLTDGSPDWGITFGARYRI